jgi:hypothetical protein
MSCGLVRCPMIPKSISCYSVDLSGVYRSDSAPPLYTTPSPRSWWLLPSFLIANASYIVYAHPILSFLLFLLLDILNILFFSSSGHSLPSFHSIFLSKYIKWNFVGRHHVRHFPVDRQGKIKNFCFFLKRSSLRFYPGSRKKTLARVCVCVCIRYL